MTSKTQQRELSLLLVVMIGIGLILTGLKMYDLKTGGLQKFGKNIYGAFISK